MLALAAPAAQAVEPEAQAQQDVQLRAAADRHIALCNKFGVDGLRFDVSAQQVIGLLDRLRATPPAPAAVAVPKDWMEHLGFVLDAPADGIWLVIDDSGGQREANITERVLWKELEAIRAALAAPQAQDVQRDAGEFPDMTPELASILGLMCFQCISFAQALRAAGHQINTRAEDEQAAVLHWMLGHWFKHGENWREHAQADMERMKEAAIAASAAKGGE